MTTQAKVTARQLPGLRRALLTWYDQNRRDLPWRNTRDPYRIWVSEIMLQQTRVAAVLLRYESFLRRFPAVSKLAAARQASVLAEWSGLGYYRRARSLHAAAKVIVRERGGEFPKTAEDWRLLPGVGRYTAAAIASIAFDQPVAVLDGNVERVLRRLLGSRGRNAESWKAADALLDRARPGDFNQSMMELGAVVCLPSQPRCSECPVRAFCRTRGSANLANGKARQQKREVTYWLTRRADSVLLVQRDEEYSLMPGMWELPEVRSHPSREKRLFSVKHSITITDFTVHVVNGEFENHDDGHFRGTWVRISRLRTLPLTGLTRKILCRAGIIKSF
jgi:A/G-specific adenine glycosylase